ncbi:hypothetical protein [Trabulsiella odontotermitis]|uniref:Membrane protein n=1 Tax=Trabulsiella odontotermitis TaxID=379893 RepID=A0A0L0GZ89_9ENTR|nr:hypothetical protein [Trabulsiella odontotermitis]KNC94016.1 membrane protein [Trabulsiella odontotermitis]
MAEIPDDYFLDADDDLVDFLEKQGEDCIRELNQSNTTNRENGYKLLSIQIVGIGSSFLLLSQKAQIDFLSAGIAVFTVYWSICAVFLVLGVLAVRQRGLISATPDVLYSAHYKNINDEDVEEIRGKGFEGEFRRLSVLRRYRLATLCRTAGELGRHNVKISTRLTRVRMATILTPACAILISVVIYFFG